VWHDDPSQVAQAKVQLAGAWALAVLCVGSHLGHHLHHLGMHQYAHSDLLTVAGQPWVGTALAAAALLGPGRELIVEGFQVRRRPGGHAARRSIRVGTDDMPLRQALGWVGMRSSAEPHQSCNESQSSPTRRLFHQPYIDAPSSTDTSGAHADTR
jgi:hypothetical protein